MIAIRIVNIVRLHRVVERVAERVDTVPIYVSCHHLISPCRARNRVVNCSRLFLTNLHENDRRTVHYTLEHCDDAHDQEHSEYSNLKGALLLLLLGHKVFRDCFACGATSLVFLYAVSFRKQL